MTQSAPEAGLADERKLVEQVLRAYHTTRTYDSDVVSHILAKAYVKQALATIRSIPASTYASGEGLADEMRKVLADYYWDDARVARWFRGKSERILAALNGGSSHDHGESE